MYIETENDFFKRNGGYYGKNKSKSTNDKI